MEYNQPSEIVKDVNFGDIAKNKRDPNWKVKIQEPFDKSKEEVLSKFFGRKTEAQIKNHPLFSGDQEMIDYYRNRTEFNQI